MVTFSRRAFVGFAAATAACACVGGASAAFGQTRDVLRPPGGQDEARFFAACLKCDRCRSVCPTGVISVSSMNDGLLSARTPKLEFHRGLCDFCGKCQQVCPTGALGAFDETRDKIGVAIVQQDRCIAWVQSDCRVCVEACPYGAITANDAGRPVVDASLCSGCGVCENACPALVYLSFSGGNRRGIHVVTLDEYERLGVASVVGEAAADGGSAAGSGVTS